MVSVPRPLRLDLPIATTNKSIVPPHIHGLVRRHGTKGKVGLRLHDLNMQ